MVSMKPKGFLSKGVNLVLEAISVWLAERHISVSVNTGVPFRVYCYFLNLYIYIYIYKIKIKKEKKEAHCCSCTILFVFENKVGQFIFT